MKKELTKAMVLCVIGMVICFVPILYKNDWILLHDGSFVIL